MAFVQVTLVVCAICCVVLGAPNLPVPIDNCSSLPGTGTGVPSLPVGGTPSLPGTGGLPSLPAGGVPTLPATGGVPTLPGTGGLPSVPVGSLPTVPGAGTLPTVPVGGSPSVPATVPATGGSGCNNGGGCSNNKSLLGVDVDLNLGCLLGSIL
ncbi:cell wall adhesin EAP1-like [Trichoplusia ni]|uniref:Cell wall adhesin EAP1-like n=1 Tax=Trichoplusia ni TaxID=7111 RepID=A0A7E5WVL2_TRINI|nr:cell wall adhesin EAP1-like [Trichoplusia ni]